MCTCWRSGLTCPRKHGAPHRVARDPKDVGVASRTRHSYHGHPRRRQLLRRRHRPHHHHTTISSAVATCPLARRRLYMLLRPSPSAVPLYQLTGGRDARRQRLQLIILTAALALGSSAPPPQEVVYSGVYSRAASRSTPSQSKSLNTVVTRRCTRASLRSLTGARHRARQCTSVDFAIAAAILGTTLAANLAVSITTDFASAAHERERRAVARLRLIDPENHPAAAAAANTSTAAAPTTAPILASVLVSAAPSVGRHAPASLLARARGDRGTAPGRAPDGYSRGSRSSPRGGTVAQ